MNVLPIDGTVIAGMGKATQTLQLQWSHLIQNFPEIKDCHRATINVELETPLFVINPDGTVPPVSWGVDPRAEGFSFLRIGFQCHVGAQPISAWIYIPHLSVNRYNLLRIEIIAPKIETPRVGVRCQIQLNRFSGFIV